MRDIDDVSGDVLDLATGASGLGPGLLESVYEIVLARFAYKTAVRPELVEGSFFFTKKEGQCFDKLSTNGFWDRL